MGAFATKVLRAEKSDLRNTVVCNSLPQILMTKVLLDKLYNREKRSAIICVTSLSSGCPSYYQSPYHSSKGLGAEVFKGEKESYRDKIDMFMGYPGYVATQMVAQRKVDFVTTDAEETAEIFLRLTGKVEESFGHWKHQFFCGYTWCLNWCFGWKFALGFGYFILRTVQKLQYKKKRPQKTQNIEEQVKAEQQLAKEEQDENKIYTTWHWVRKPSVIIADSSERLIRRLSSFGSRGSNENAVTTPVAGDIKPKAE